MTSRNSVKKYILKHNTLNNGYTNIMHKHMVRHLICTSINGTVARECVKINLKPYLGIESFQNRQKWMLIMSQVIKDKRLLSSSSDYLPLMVKRHRSRKADLGRILLRTASVQIEGKLETNMGYVCLLQNESTPIPANRRPNLIIKEMLMLNRGLSNIYNDVFTETLKCIELRTSVINHWILDLPQACLDWSAWYRKPKPPF